MARLFTAVELTPGVRSAVAQRQAELARALTTRPDSGLRMVEAGQLHLTLVFIGEVDDTRVPAITDLMGVALPMAPFDIEFASCGMFPPRGPARVLWLGVNRGATELTALFGLVAARLESVGLEKDPRPFTAHLTLGRWRDRRGPAARPQLPDAGPIAGQTVSSVTLFRSRLLPRGPEHTPLAHAALTASPLH